MTRDSAIVLLWRYLKPIPFEVHVRVVKCIVHQKCTNFCYAFKCDACETQRLQGDTIAHRYIGIAGVCLR